MHNHDDKIYSRGDKKRQLYPEITRLSPKVVSMLGQRRRRWSNIEPTLAERLVFAGDYFKVGASL